MKNEQDNYSEDAAKRIDNNAYADETSLFVEGYLDTVFFEEAKDSYTIKFSCRDIDVADKKAQDRLNEIPNIAHTEDTFYPNRQKIIDRLNNEPNPKEYGLIDKDFERPNGNNNLFCTDTHDLETLLFFNHETLLNRFCELNISSDTKIINKLNEDFKTAIYLAYQTGIIRRAIHTINKKFKAQRIQEHYFIKHGTRLDYKEFSTKNNKIKLESFCKYINEHGCHANADKLKEDDNIKNHFSLNLKDKAFIFKKKKDDICDPSQTQKCDFWNIVNGHDICDFLCLINNDVKIKYNITRSDKSRKNDLEKAIIKSFCYPRFSNTALYASMKRQKLIEKN